LGLLLATLGMPMSIAHSEPAPLPADKATADAAIRRVFGLPEEESLPSPAASPGGRPDGQNLTTMEIVVALSAVVMTIAAIAMAVWMRLHGVMSADQTFQLIGLSLTLGGSLFLIGAGYGQDQIAPAMGFLGTALGFIFGRNSAAPAATPAISPPVIPPAPPSS
jgi:hypothetical protein